MNIITVIAEFAFSVVVIIISILVRVAVEVIKEIQSRKQYSYIFYMLELVMLTKKTEQLIFLIK